VSRLRKISKAFGIPEAEVLKATALGGVTEAVSSESTFSKETPQRPGYDPLQMIEVANGA
jgi:hypothetical protein